MFFGRADVPPPTNEPVKSYAPGSPERASLQAELARQKAEVPEGAAVIGGERVTSGNLYDVTSPHDHGHVLRKVHQVGAAETERAIEVALEAKDAWSRTSFEARAAVILKAAELLAGPWRDRLNAATMLGQGKTCHQAEIDSACELIDFWRFNVDYAAKIYADQPNSPTGTWNRLDYRPLDGFVFCPTPFNFTAIMANLPTAPALCGNVCIWKPSETTLHAACLVMELLEEAGLPPGVINLVPGPPAEVAPPCLAHPDLAGVHFTGSTGTFQHIWKTVGENIAGYRNYPRVVGETGGKDFVFAHPSADPETLVTALVRGAFEYQGQKCSAASRAFVPRSLWDAVKGPLIEQTASLTMGDVCDFTNFMGAVIDARAFEKITGYIEHARGANDCEVLVGGESDAATGYFIRPTVVQSTDPRSKLMVEEIFGPVLTVHVYEDSELDALLDVCESASPYALTGAIFGRDRVALEAMADRLRNAAGNFYINDKPTGAVVGQQPFGGARASGTNDKAGSYLNLLRWISPRTIKETFVPPTDYRYPFLGPDA